MGVFIPIFFFIVVALIWGAYLLTRHRERMTIIERGLNPEDLKAMYASPSRAGNPLTSLKWGILLVCIGAAILLGLWIHEAYDVNEGVIPGLMAVLGGAGLVSFYFIARRRVEA